MKVVVKSNPSKPQRVNVRVSKDPMSTLGRVLQAARGEQINEEPSSE